ncbi:Hypothetical protein LUCI_1450 [Lucifera butyrica]|uniref:CoA-binding domain-containing protein n=1 Tax=Lucifera butyrica TaxID=1351585 RepID=A0A498R482_9FIRM|nr:CoA-binding protein [Lucifera butyrica]VBB06234.1 Hypothetical protein LUCI_1450 [Lucifera butyrica]
MDEIQKMLALKTWAVVGATNNQEKFGYKIFKFMKEAGFTVYPVNPGVSEVLGETCYPALQDLPVKPDAVDFVVPASVGEKVMRDCAALGIKNVWLQPGADAPGVVKAAQELGLTAVRACIMVESRKAGIGV